MSLYANEIECYTPPWMMNALLTNVGGFEKLRHSKECNDASKADAVINSFWTILIASLLNADTSIDMDIFCFVGNNIVVFAHHIAQIHYYYYHSFRCLNNFGHRMRSNNNLMPLVFCTWLLPFLLCKLLEV